MSRALRVRVRKRPFRNRPLAARRLPSDEPDRERSYGSGGNPISATSFWKDGSW